MPTLKDAPMEDQSPVPDIEVPQFSPLELLEIQSVFGQLIQSNPRLVKLINATGPVLFATLLFTTCEDYAETDDGDLQPRNSATEAEAKAIGVLRGIAQAMGALEGDITFDVSDAEVEADTDIEPVQ